MLRLEPFLLVFLDLDGTTITLKYGKLILTLHHILPLKLLFPPTCAFASGSQRRRHK